MNHPLLLLLALLFSHTVCDYSPLSRPYMLKAKSIGSPLNPIFEHAIVHMVGMGFVFIMFGFSSEGNVLIPALLLLELVSHFLIDTLKGKLNVWHPTVKDTSKYAHWCIFGLDQYLHQLVIVLIWWIAITH